MRLSDARRKWIPFTYFTLQWPPCNTTVWQQSQTGDVWWFWPFGCQRGTGSDTCKYGCLGIQSTTWNMRTVFLCCVDIGEIKRCCGIQCVKEQWNYLSFALSHRYHLDVIISMLFYPYSSGLLLCMALGRSYVRPSASETYLWTGLVSNRDKTQQSKNRVQTFLGYAPHHLSASKLCLTYWPMGDLNEILDI